MRDLFKPYREILISKFEVTEERFNQDFNEWVIKYGISKQSKNDFIWSMFNRLVSEALSKPGNMFYNLRWLYAEMWQFLIKEKKNATHIKKEMLYCDLVLAEEETYKVLANIITNCCPECDKFDGLKIPLTQAILTQPLPVPECTRLGGCICCYSFRAERDSKGNIVMK